MPRARPLLDRYERSRDRALFLASVAVRSRASFADLASRGIRADALFESALAKFPHEQHQLCGDALSHEEFGGLAAEQRWGQLETSPDQPWRPSWVGFEDQEEELFLADARGSEPLFHLLVRASHARISQGALVDGAQERVCESAAALSK